MNLKEDLLWLMAIVCISASISCGSNTPEESNDVATGGKTVERGQQIVAEYLKRDSAPYRKTKARITVVEADSSKKAYILESSRRQTKEETRTLTRATEPAEFSDLASLTIEHKGKPTVNVSYIASQERFRESGTGKMFFGGLTSQELLGEWDKYDCTFVDETTVNEKKLFETDCKLKKGERSVIARIAATFDAATYLPTGLRLFNSDDKKLRTFVVTETRTVGERVVVAKTEIENHIQNSKVTIELLDVTFPDKIADEVFERDYLKQFAKENPSQSE